MKIKMHLPRESEAKLVPSLKQDLDIFPKFYKKTGFTPVLYFTAIDSKGNEEQYILTINASTKSLKIDKMVEVIPACDEEEQKEEQLIEVKEEVNE